MTRYELLLPVKRKDGKTTWRNIGSAFEARDGKGFDLVFDALPMPGPDGCRVLMRLPLAPRDDAAPTRVTSGVRQTAGDALDDEIPF
jgi:hypothetical protein